MPMCLYCRRAIDLRAAALRWLAVFRDNRKLCARLRTRIDAEIEERTTALDLDSPADEQV